MTDDKRLIEDFLPVAQVSYESTFEKLLRKRNGHISTLHLWWARRPLAAARAAVYGALAPVPESREELPGFFQKLCRWGNEGGPDVKEARARVLANNGGQAPRVLDMFAGGGAIPLEAIRLGCDAHALDLNPVAHIIQLSTLVYPQRYGERLAQEVQRWGQVVIERVKAKVGDLYPSFPDPHQTNEPVQLRFNEGMQLRLSEENASAPHLVPVAYLWTRTVKCPNPALHPHDVPLMRQTWLVKKKGRFIALKPVAHRENLTLSFDVVSAATEAGLGFDPESFSVQGNSTCPLCGTPVTKSYIKEQGQHGGLGARLMGVVAMQPGARGKAYYSADELHAYLPSDPSIAERLVDECARSGLTIPTGEVPARLSGGTCYGFGLTKIGDLFTPRQMLTLLTFAAEIRNVNVEMVEAGETPDFAKAVTTYLGILLNRIADRSSTLCHWDNSRETTSNTFGRQALPMVWDFSEVNPFGGSSGDSEMHLEYITDVIRHCAKTGAPATVYRGDATRLPWSDDYFDAIITDPPYYDNISYADLSDFFYAWFKRSIGHLYPEHFRGEVTPKKGEAIAASYRHGGNKDAARSAYEDMMFRALSEANRVLKPGAPLVIVYAHKTTMGWATLVDALRRAGFMVTEAWPLDTEMPDRVGQMNTASLASSIFLVARRRESDRTGDYIVDVRPQLSAIVEERADTLWQQGIQGADLIIACVGAGLRAYTQFARVELGSGEELPASRFLDEVQREVLEVVLARVLHCERQGVGAVDKPTQYYVLGRYQYKEGEVDFDEANNLAKGVGVDLDGPRALTGGQAALVKKAKDKVRLRDYTERGAREDLGLSEGSLRAPLIDVLHRLLWLYDNQPEAIPDYLGKAGANPEQLRLVTQALAGRALAAENRPGQAQDGRSREQKTIDGLLAAWNRLIEQPGQRGQLRLGV